MRRIHRKQLSCRLIKRLKESCFGIIALILVEDNVVIITQAGAVGAPIGGQVLSEVLPYLELAKDNETEEDVKKQVEVPNIEKMTIVEATKELKKLGLQLQIQNEPEELDENSTIIKEQLPKKGISVYEGAKIIVTIQ